MERSHKYQPPAGILGPPGHIIRPNGETWPRPPSFEGERMTVDEASMRHLGEWILLEVTELDEHFNPYAGVLAAHDPDNDHVWATLNELVRKTDRSDPNAPQYYVFHGHKPISAEEYRRRLLNGPITDEDFAEWEETDAGLLE